MPRPLTTSKSDPTKQTGPRQRMISVKHGIVAFTSRESCDARVP
jgi:hypothetical protein